MIIEIQKIIEEGIDKEEVEAFDDGSYQVSNEILQKIYIAGYMEGVDKKSK